MRGIESARDGEAQFYTNCDPVAEGQPLLSKITANQKIPFRQIVYEEGSANSQDPLAFGEPALAPIHILAIWQLVVDFLSVIFGQVERRIGEDRVYARISNVRKYAKTVAVQENTTCRSESLG